MFCVNCGAPINEGELICKGCSKLSANVRDELLSFTEKSNANDSGLKCKKCGADIGAGYQYCNKCGAATTP